MSTLYTDDDMAKCWRSAITHKHDVRKLDAMIRNGTAVSYAHLPGASEHGIGNMTDNMGIGS